MLKNQLPRTVRLMLEHSHFGSKKEPNNKLINKDLLEIQEKFKKLNYKL